MAFLTVVVVMIIFSRLLHSTVGKGVKKIGIGCPLLLLKVHQLGDPSTKHVSFRIEAHADFFRWLMKGTFGPYSNLLNNRVGPFNRVSRWQIS